MVISTPGSDFLTFQTLGKSLQDVRAYWMQEHKKAVIPEFVENGRQP